MRSLLQRAPLSGRRAPELQHQLLPLRQGGVFHRGRRSWRRAGPLEDTCSSAQSLCAGLLLESLLFVRRREEPDGLGSQQPWSWQGGLQNLGGLLLCSCCRGGFWGRHCLSGCLRRIQRCWCRVRLEICCAAGDLRA